MNIHLLLRLLRTRDIHKEQLVRRRAISLLVKDGLEGFRMSKLARACRISVATLYIYYKDKGDLIRQIAMEEFDRMMDAILAGFHAEMTFEEGLRVQWKNRATYLLEHPTEMQLFEQLRGSRYHEKIFSSGNNRFKETLGRFVQNAIERGEIAPMPIELFWATAYGSLYTLLRFSHEGRNMGGQPFTLTDEMIWRAFDVTIKGLKK